MFTKRRILAAATLLSFPFGFSYAQAATQPAEQTVPKVKKSGVVHHRTSIGSDQPLHSVPKIRTRKARDASGDSGESVIVTGTHAFNRKARDSAVPVTVVSAATLRRSGQLNLADAITRVDPSITVTANGADAGALTSAIRMRGLNPNEVLVLVDGKRRNTTANIYADAGPQQGSTPVDLNMIPAGA
ncbi:TonB-dependent receptor plug domain-containing protein, partial [Asaia sp. SF2.1]